MNMHKKVSVFKLFKLDITQKKKKTRFYVQQLSEKIWAFCTGTVGAWYF